MKVTLRELGYAYRRVKADLCRAHGVSAFKLVRYERNLLSNLTRLKRIFEAETFREFDSFCSGFLIVPKSAEFPPENEAVKVFSRTDEKQSMQSCELRLMEDIPVEFHMVMQLWIDRIGDRLESCFSKHSFGNRLRSHCGKLNLSYPGSFKYYIRQYKSWHDGALDVIDKALVEKRDVVVMTADFTAFYHNLNPDFLLDTRFWNEMGIRRLSASDQLLTKCVVSMLKKWAASTPLGVGLPVGCSISSVIANAALTRLDRKIEDLKGLIHYGRYVDDIILVVERPKSFGKRSIGKAAFFRWIAENVSGIIVSDAEDLIYKEESFTLAKEGLSFKKKKTKIFVLGGDVGLGFVRNLKEQIRHRNSEWRLLPELPLNPRDLYESFVAVSDLKGNEVGKLRDSDQITLRRAAFSARLADFTAYADCLHPEDWRPQRIAFLKAIEVYFTTPKYYFDLASYFPRIVALAAGGVTDDSSEEFKVLQSIFSRIALLLDDASCVKQTLLASRQIGGWCSVVDIWRKLRDGVVAAFTESIVSSVHEVALRDLLLTSLWTSFGVEKKRVENFPEYDELLLSDLGQEPYSHILSTVYDVQKTQIQYGHHPVVGLDKILGTEVNDIVVSLLSQRNEWLPILRSAAFAGLVFPVRPLKPNDLYALLPSPYDKRGKSRAVILKWMELMSYGDKQNEFLCFNRNQGKPFVMQIPRTAADNDPKSATDSFSSFVGHEFRPKIALAYWHVSDSAYEGQISGRFLPKDRAETFSRLMRLLEKISKTDKKIDYIVFPELAMSWRWFLFASRRLKSIGISLISGVEYLPCDNASLTNEVWCSLRYCGLGFPDFALVRVVKTAPALHEKESLETYGKHLECSVKNGSFRAGDVIEHGVGANSLFFSVLVCSDLTDVDLRAKLRGVVDLLFVPAWNIDLETFHDIVSSSAFDLHAYIVLCNNGSVGDTRIRAPAQIRYKRDLVRLQGGEDDYFVIGSVDVGALRRSQAGVLGVGDPSFKPTPIGFAMSKARRKATSPRVGAGSSYKYIKATDTAFEILWQEPKTNEPIDVGLKIEYSKLKTSKEIVEYICQNLLPCSYFPKEGVEEFISACNSCLGSKIVRTEKNGVMCFFGE